MFKKISINNTMNDIRRNRIIINTILVIISVIPHLIYHTYGKVLEYQPMELWCYFSLYLLILFVNNKIYPLHDNERVVYYAFLICLIANREHIVYACMDLYIILLLKYILIRFKYTREYHQYILSFIVAILIAVKETSHFFMTFGISLMFGILLALLETIITKVLLPKQNKTKREKVLFILNGLNDETQINDFCVSKGLPNLGETIYLFINNTLEETSNILDVETSTITRRVNKFIDKCTSAGSNAPKK